VTDIRRQDLYLWVRPFQTIYQAAVFLLVLASTKVAGEQSNSISGLVIVSLTAPALILVNDYLHASNDRLMERDRYFVQRNNGRAKPLGFALCTVILCGIWEGTISFAALAMYLVLIAAATLYGFFKARGQITVAYGLRAFYGFQAYLAMAVPRGLRLRDLVIGLALALADLATNIAGDIRDLTKDRKASLSTLPSLWGLPKTSVLLLGMHLISLLVLGIVLQTNTTSWKLVSLAGFLLTSFMSFRVIDDTTSLIWAHAIHHGSKVFQIVLLASMVLFDNAAISLLIAGSMLGVWYYLYRRYLQADGRLQDPAEQVRQPPAMDKTHI